MQGAERREPEKAPRARLYVIPRPLRSGWWKRLLGWLRPGRRVAGQSPLPPTRPLRRIAAKALTLPSRRFFAPDQPRLNRVSGQLQVEWLARDVLPFARNPDEQRQEQLFCQQTLSDTCAVIVRLFALLPEIERLDVRVVQPWSPKTLILAGTVTRQDVLASRPLSSPGTRLQSMGIRYRLVNGHLAPLD